MTGRAAPIRAGLLAADADSVRLVAAACVRCEDIHFPASDTCPYCGGETIERHVGPDGVLRLCTIVQRPPPGYAGPVPYGFGVVEVSGTGLEVVSRITGDPAHAVPGAPVRLVLEEIPTDRAGATAMVWAFEPTR
jgi:uncharacterized OB-fold protein